MTIDRFCKQALHSMSLLLVGWASIITMQAQSPQLNYYRFGEGIDITGKDGYSMNVRGYAQPMMEVKDYTDEGYDQLLNRFRLRRMRLRISGESEPLKIDYRVQFDLSGSSEIENAEVYYLMDAYIAYNPTPRIKILFGQRATETNNREMMMGSHALQLIERSRVTSAFATIREFGLFARGRFRLGGSQYLRPYIAITNGDGQNVFTRDRGGLKYGFRLDYLPFGLFTNIGQFRQADVVREPAPKLAIGVVGSYNNEMSSRRGRVSGSIVYLDANNEESLPDYFKIGADFMFKWRGFSAIGEFVYADATVPDDIVYRVRNNGSVANTFLVDGVQDVENYVKGRMMLGAGYNIQLGYVFKNGFSIDGRYAHLQPAEHSFLYNGTFYNRPNYYTLGVTQYLSKGYGFKIQGSLTYVEVDPGSNDIFGNPITGDEWIGRVIATIAF